MRDEVFKKMFPHNVSIVSMDGNTYPPTEVTIYSGVADCQLSVSNLVVTSGVLTPTSTWKCFTPMLTDENLIQGGMKICMHMGNRIVSATIHQTYTVDLINYKNYKYGSIIYAITNPLT